MDEHLHGGTVAERLWTPGVDATDTLASRAEQLFHADEAALAKVNEPRFVRGNKWSELMEEGRELLITDPRNWSVSDLMHAQEIIDQFRIRILEHEAWNTPKKANHG